MNPSFVIFLGTIYITCSRIVSRACHNRLLHFLHKQAISPGLLDLLNAKSETHEHWYSNVNRLKPIQVLSILFFRRLSKLYSIKEKEIHSIYTYVRVRACMGVYIYIYIIYCNIIYIRIYMIIIYQQYIKIGREQ